MQTVGIAGLEAIAAERIIPPAWDYYRSGAGAEFTLRDNEDAYQRYTWDLSGSRAIVLAIFSLICKL